MNNKIDHKKDFLLNCMTHHALDGIYLLVHYFQKKTPYGETYQKTFEQYKVLMEEFDKFVGCLSECVDEYTNSNSSASQEELVENISSHI